ncbi:hypothetical protein SISSUDRAFT_589635 [Sistotremastrum suecicum HHB10207 ss-3]|uniref:EH domain-containing protein n=1 Tax=Sistotremastrum suecicum HHB10207 ss-3 TaxID=1314776 RepID=A0A166EM86_9AGAM|nr:hypothetical protein SISSUDRAFT_589635 [Sistotremastrum suecicum HHB10207 ss-3]
MPSAAIQSRIQAFEAIAQSPKQKTASSSSPVPSLTRIPPPSLVSDDLLDSPISPTASSLSHISPMIPTPTDSRSSSPAILGRKSSLIDLTDLDIPNSTSKTVSGRSQPNGERETPYAGQRSPPPPLPPRRPSSNSIISLSTPTTTQTSTLTVTPATHTYPPLKPGNGRGRHIPASSTSSFHSVSLSSDGGGGTRDSVSLDESFETLSASTVATSASPPLSETYTTISKPPQLPPRPNPAPTKPTATLRRPPPPPPVQSKAKLLLTASRRDIPPESRARYEAVFDRNISQQSATKPISPTSFQSRARAWRGPSVDLTTATLQETSKSNPRLNGHTVKLIWSCSKLSRHRLRAIWDEVNPSLRGSLDKESFVKGMWRIDEELRVAQRVSQRRPVPAAPKR